MSQVFIIEDLTIKKILHEGSLRFFSQIINLVGESEVPFFRDYDFNPSESQKRDVILGTHLIHQIDIIIKNLNEQPKDLNILGMDLDLILDLFEDLKRHCHEYKNNQYTCYVYS